MRADRLRDAIEQMEAWLADMTWDPDPEALAQWELEFRAALAEYKKGSGAIDMIDRAHSAGKLLDARIRSMEDLLVQMRTGLEAQGLGNRALRGYGASTR